MAFVCVQGDSTAIPMYCSTSSSVVKGGLCVFDRSAGTVIPATAALLVEDIAGVAAKTPATADTWVSITPIRGQLWEWDCTNATATDQLCKRSLLTDTSTVANTSTDQAVDEVVVTPILNVSASKQRGYINTLGAAVS